MYMAGLPAKSAQFSLPPTSLASSANAYQITKQSSRTRLANNRQALGLGFVTNSANGSILQNVMVPNQPVK